MPAKSPRIIFTPAPETHDLLQRFSAATGQPVSAVVRDMLGTIGPHLATMVDLLERASQLSEGVREAAGVAAKEAGGALIPLLEEAERAMANLERILDEPGLPLTPRPPSSNTGATRGPAVRREAA